jgi:hypothetical protein
MREPAPHLMRGGCRFWAPVRLTLARQSETVGWTTGLGGRDEADQDGGHWACFYRGSFAARDWGKRANRDIRDADGAGIATRGRRAGPGSTDGSTRADLPAQPAGTRWCLSALFSGPQRGAGLHGNLCAGIPAERHGDRAPDELLLAPRLTCAASRPSANITFRKHWCVARKPHRGRHSSAQCCVHFTFTSPT